MGHQVRAVRVRPPVTIQCFHQLQVLEADLDLVAPVSEQLGLVAALVEVLRAE